MSMLQILVILFALFFLSRVYLRFKDKNVSLGELFFWTVILVSLMTFTLFPGALGWFTTFTGVGRPIDLVLYISVILLFYLIFRLYVWFHDLDRKLTKVVREIAKNGKKK